MGMKFMITVVPRVIRFLKMQGLNMPGTDNPFFQIRNIVRKTNVFIIGIQICIQNKAVIISGNTGVDNLLRRNLCLIFMKIVKLLF